MEEKKGQKGFLKESALFLLDILYNAVIIIVLVILIRTFLISPFRVIGSSMADTLESNEFILIDKLSYRLGEPKRGDPIVFRPPITNKYGNKFEETLALDPSGQGVLEFSGLKSKKNAIYCQNPLTSSLWFCQESVNPGDMVFYRRLSENVSADDMGGDWKNATEAVVSDADIKAQKILLHGEPNQSYQVRVFDSSGPEYFVKRIIGTPGDTVKIENGLVYIKKAGETDFKEIPENYLNEENKNHTYMTSKADSDMYVVSPGEYFVMGDNRNHSNDSRSWFSPISQEPVPLVPAKNISGKVMVVLWPFNAMRLIHSASSSY